MEFFVKPGEDEEWHQYWIDERTRWYVDLGIDPDNLRHYEHPQEKLSHYSKRTVDIEYRFRFAGSEWGELEGIANRTDFDLTTHAKHSGQDLSYFDQATNERYTPYVIEPAAGLSRSLMTFLVDAYTEDEAPNTKGGVDKRTVLRLDPRLAPVKVAVLPLSPQRRPVAQGQGPRDRAAPRLERRLRRLRRDRPALPPPGRDRYAVLRHRRLRDPRGRRGHGPRARHAWSRSGSRSTRSRRTSPSVSSAAERRRACRMCRMSGQGVPGRAWPSRRCVLRGLLLRRRRRARREPGRSEPEPGRPARRRTCPVPDGRRADPAGQRAGGRATPRPSPTSCARAWSASSTSRCAGCEKTRRSRPSPAGSSATPRRSRTPYFVRATDHQRRRDRPRRPRVPLYIVDGDNTAARGDDVRQHLQAVPSTALPEEVRPRRHRAGRAWSSSRPTRATWPR